MEKKNPENLIGNGTCFVIFFMEKVPIEGNPNKYILKIIIEDRIYSIKFIKQAKY